MKTSLLKHRFLYFFILLSLEFTLYSCSEDGQETKLEEPCYSFWTNGSKSRDYRGGTVSITDRNSNITCSYDAILSIRYSSNNILSATIEADVNSLGDLCSYGSVVGYIDECRTDYLSGERIIFDTRRETIFIVKDAKSFEGSAQIFDTDDSGNEYVLADFIFSVPF